MSKKVLIVDDSKFSTKRNRELLENLDYSVIGEAVDGIDGLIKFKELQPDLIITDLEMPNLDGLSMIKMIREIDQDIHIIIITSITNAQTMHEASKQKTIVLKKPIKGIVLENAIKLLKR